MGDRRGIPRLEDGAKTYYKRVESILDGEEEEGTQLFLKNVAEQVISDGALRVCCDKDGSRTVERLLQHSLLDMTSITNLMEALSPDYCRLIMDRCGSHIVEALLKAVAVVLEANRTEPPTDLLQDFLSLCNTIKEHMPVFLTHAYASHVLSALLQVLSGVYLSDHVNRSRYSQEFRKAKMSDTTGQRGVVRIEKMRPVPDSFLKQLDGIAKRLSKLDNLGELLSQQCASPVLQTLLRVLTQVIPERGTKLIKKIIKYSKVLSTDSTVSKKDDGDITTHLPELFTDVVGSHLMECMIEVAPQKLYQSIYDTCFKGMAMKFALHPVANYPLQQLISSAQSSQVCALIKELVPLEEILFVGHTGVVIKLAQAAVSCPEKQPTLFQALMNAFHTETKPKCCVPLFLALTTYEVLFASDKMEEKAAQPKPVCVHGSLLVQALLKFQDTKTVVNSLLKMKSDDIVRVSCDPSGSHVITTFMTSSTVSSKKKHKMISSLETNLVPLCKDKHGSRVVDVLWRQCEIAKKEELAETLLANEEELSDDFYGQIILRNCNISHYKKKQIAWQEQQRVAERKRQLFQDIIEEEHPAPKRMKQKSSERHNESSDNVVSKKKIALFGD